jgi:hypothetical protein
MGVCLCENVSNIAEMLLDFCKTVSILIF